MPGVWSLAAPCMRRSIVRISPAPAKKRYGNACWTAHFARGFRLNIQTVRFVASLLGAAAALTASLAHAQVYKCAGEGGIPVYQEMPCSPGKELRNFQTDPPEITILPARRPSSIPAADVIREAPAKNAKADKDAKVAKAGNAANAANAAERAHLRVGMTEAEVLARVGNPDVTVGTKGTPSPRWTYMPAPGDSETTTMLQFSKGVVVDIDRRVIKK